MKKIFALCAIALSCNAFAADNGVYVGADIGRSNFSAAGESMHKTGFGGLVGYQINENFAVEVAARRLGKESDSGMSLSMNALQLSVLGSVVATPEAKLFARLGMSRNSIEVSEGNLSVSLDKTKALFGLGLDYAFNKNMTLRTEWSHLGTSEFAPGASIKATQLNLGLVYKF